MGGLGWEIEGPPDATLRGQFARAADAHLIAAAPEMYEALVELGRFLSFDMPSSLAFDLGMDTGFHEEFEMACNKVVAVLKKAQGEGGNDG
jgi:hypothetical protein